MVLAGDVLHDIHGTRNLALVTKGYRGIQNGLLGPVQAWDLDNLAQYRLAFVDGTCDGPLVTLDRPTGIWPPAAIVFVVSQSCRSDTPNSPRFLIQLLNRPRPVNNNNPDGYRFENDLCIPFFPQQPLSLLQISILPGLQ